MKGGAKWLFAGIKDGVFHAAAVGIADAGSPADATADGAAGGDFVELVTECKNCP